MSITPELLVSVLNLAADVVLLVLTAVVVVTWRKVENYVVARLVRRAHAEDGPDVAALRAELRAMTDEAREQLRSLAAIDRALREHHAGQTTPLPTLRPTAAETSRTDSPPGSGNSPRSVGPTDGGA